MNKSTKDAEFIKFMGLFARLKDWCDDMPDGLADLLARIADHKNTDLAALLPWTWRRALRIDRAA